MPVGRMPESTRRFWMGPLMLRPDHGADHPPDHAQGRIEQPAEQPEHRETEHQEQPDRFEFLQTRSPLRGQQSASTRPPSSGGTGSRLNTASTTLTTMPACAMSAIQPNQRLICRRRARSPRARRTIRPPSPSSPSARRRPPGSSPAWMAQHTGRHRHRLGPTESAGPPMASSTPGTSTVPTGSMWRSGLRLRRPSISAVRSPKYRAIQPCATSCRVIAESTGNGPNGDLIKKGR